jgi:hypothetical protein
MPIAFFLWRSSPNWAQAAPLLRFLEHTQTYLAGLLWTSDQLVAEVATYTTHNNQKRRTSAGPTFTDLFVEIWQQSIWASRKVGTVVADRYSPPQWNSLKCHWWNPLPPPLPGTKCNRRALRVCCDVICSFYALCAKHSWLRTYRVAHACSLAEFQVLVCCSVVYTWNARWHLAYPTRLC